LKKPSPRVLKLAFGSVPKDSGTFTFYRNIRPELAALGVEMFCVAVGKAQAQLWDDDYADEHCVLLAAHTHRVKVQAQVFVQWAEREEIDLVMGINSEAILSAIPHLPPKIRAVSRCANGFDHGYRITLSGRDRLMAIVALTPKLRADLIEQYGAEASRIHLIPNGIDPVPFTEAAKRTRGATKTLRLGFLGRLENNQKGVFHLPKIVQALNALNLPFALEIAGKGRHRDIIESEMAAEIQNGQVRFLGPLSPQEVSEFLGSLDLLLFPSHFEGCPNTLLEAMMAGVVPLAWRIAGTTDFIIDQDQNGFVFTTGDYAALAQTVSDLEKDRSHLAQLSLAAACKAREEFTPAIAAAAYHRVFRSVMEEEHNYVAKPWRSFTPDPNFEHNWTEFLPQSWLNTFKQLKSRLLRV